MSVEDAMHERDTTQEPWTSRTQKLNFLEQTLLDGFRWQEAWALADEEQKATAKPLRKRLAAVLHFVMRRIQVKRGQAHKQCLRDIEVDCLDLCCIEDGAI
jgi:hypothetical protein